MNLHLQAFKDEITSAVTKLGNLLKLAPHVAGLENLEAEAVGILAKAQAAVEMVETGAGVIDAGIKQLEAVIASAMTAATPAPGTSVPAPSDPAPPAAK